MKIHPVPVFPSDRLTSVSEGWAAWQFNADTGFENAGQQAELAQRYGI
jgi:hypothetical protein